MYSMLDGDALTAVEHLEFAEFAVDGGETLIFNILEARYLDKDPIDRAGRPCSMCSKCRLERENV